MTTVIATQREIFTDSICIYSASFNTPKVFKFKSEGDGREYLMAGAGDLNELAFVVEMVRKYGLHELWRANLQDNWPPSIVKDMETDVVAVCVDGMFLIDKSFMPAKCLDSTYTFGSGGDMAKAAMTFGYKLRDAMDYAIRMDPMSGGKIQHMELS